MVRPTSGRMENACDAAACRMNPASASAGAAAEAQALKTGLRTKGSAAGWGGEEARRRQKSSIAASRGAWRRRPRLGCVGLVGKDGGCGLRWSMGRPRCRAFLVGMLREK